ncbi:MAG: carboxypeptidase-like regulatory domain-containing protein [Flavobacteriales bacterium]
MKTVRKRAGWLGQMLAILLVFSSFYSTAQDEKKKPPVKVLESRVSDKLSSKPIAGATVEVYKNGSLIETKTVASNGKYKITPLELDHTYKIIFKAPGYVSRFIEVDLKNIPLEDVFGKGWEVPLDMTLPERLPDLDFAPVENKITSTLKYEKSTGEVEFNRNQLDAYSKELDKILKKAEEAKKADEKKKAEAEAKYVAAMKAADDAVKKDDYAGGLAKYNEALVYKEKDPTATAKIKETEIKKVEWEKKNMAE